MYRYQTNKLITVQSDDSHLKFLLQSRTQLEFGVPALASSLPADMFT